MTVNWRAGLTREQIRDAEMQRGIEVITTQHHALHDVLAREFDPDYKPPTPTHYVSPEGREYSRRLAAANKDREDFK